MALDIHQVYLVDGVNRRLTPALATVPKKEAPEVCCRVAAWVESFGLSEPGGFF